MCGFVVVPLQGGAVSISGSGASGTFANCSFTSNTAVSRCSNLQGTCKSLTVVCGALCLLRSFLQKVSRVVYVYDSVQDLR